MEKDFSLEDVVKLTNDIVIVTEAYPLDAPGPKIVYVNKAFTDVTGFAPEEVIGKTPRILQGPDSDPETRAEIRAALKKKNLSEQSSSIILSLEGSIGWISILFR